MRPIEKIGWMGVGISVPLWMLWMIAATYSLSVAIPSQVISLDFVCVLLSVSCLFFLFSASGARGGISSVYFVTLSTLVLFNAAQAFLLPWIPADASLADPQYKYILTRQFSDDVLIRTFSLIGTFLAAFHVGALAVGANEAVSSSVHQPLSRFGPVEVQPELRTAIVTLFALTAPLGLNQMYASLSVVMEKGYFGLYDPSQQVYQSAFAVLATFALPASIYLVHVCGGTMRLIGLAYVMVHGLSMLTMGFRAWGMLSLIALAYIIHRTVRPIGRAAVFTTMGLLLMLLPLIGATRNTALTDLDLRKIGEAYETIGSPVFSLLSETGGSAATVAWTMELVPAEREFGWGSSYATSATSVVPNLVGGTHVSTEKSLSSWLVWRVSPENAAIGGGIGFSALAELYLNFGFLVGSVVALGLGALMGWANLQFERYRYDPVVSAAGAVLLTFLPMYARSDSSMLFRPLLWFVLLPLFMTRTLGLRRAPPRSAWRVHS